MQLPELFIESARLTMGERRFQRFMEALDEPSPVSIRVNMRKMEDYPFSISDSQLRKVPWCPTGYYLPNRPNFTFDPLLHAGCYYVQEASSMFIDHVLRLYVQTPVDMLDLCAAPGGKSTAARAALPEGSMLVSNEPIRQRAQILSENIQKWGYPDCIVTNCYPKDFRKARCLFDVILCDVPCSGEGMFRKDPQAVAEWSQQNVEHCWRLQREIVGEAWQCLKEGGLLIYSTCTYNTKENEENVRWIQQELGGQVLPAGIETAWNVTGSLLKGFDEPVCRFIPGFTQGEGLFMAVLRKPDGNASRCQREALPSTMGSITIFNANADGRVATSKKKEREPVPSPAEALSLTLEEGKYPQAELDYPTAIAYLRGEAVTLSSDTPRGFVIVSFKGRRLGFVKNIGNRANNLFPKEWRIKSTHIPQEYETIFRLA